MRGPRRVDVCGHHVSLLSASDSANPRDGRRGTATDERSRRTIDPARATAPNRAQIGAVGSVLGDAFSAESEDAVVRVNIVLIERGDDGVLTGVEVLAEHEIGAPVGGDPSTGCTVRAVSRAC